MQLLIGADPELFVKKDGQFVSAHGMIEGDKKNPKPVRSGAVQVDGMALEFNIEPASTKDEFLFNVEDVMGQLEAMVPGYELAVTPVAEFGKEYIDSQPYEAKELGCDPDYNAWNGQENRKPDEEQPFRTAAGHIHIGWTDNANVKSIQHKNMVESAVRQLDFFLGLPSLFFDDDVKRREMYGKAGAYRSKPYGCEYRTLSNKWLSSKNLMSMVYDNVHQAFTFLRRGDDLVKKYGNIEHIINTSDKVRASEILDAEGIPYVL